MIREVRKGDPYPRESAIAHQSSAIDSPLGIVSVSGSHGSAAKQDEDLSCIGNYSGQLGRMNPPVTFVTVVILLVFLGSSFAAQPSRKGRTLTDIDAISTRVLQRSISPKFYKSLLVSPIQGWIVVRAQLSGTRLFGMSVVHSELDGAYDGLALERAKAVTISGYSVIDKANHTGNVLVHLLIYKVADGTMALSFVQLDEAGGDQQEYFGCAVLGVRKQDGKWVEIKSVDSLQAKGLAVRKSRNAMRDIWFFAGFQGKGR